MLELGTFKDTLNNLNYKLYRLTFKQIKELLYRNKPLSTNAINIFDSGTSLSYSIFEYITRKKLHRHFENLDGSSTESVYRADIISNVLYANESQHRLSKFSAKSGIETSYILLEADGDLNDNNTKVLLLDGYRRLFSTTENLDNYEVFVKVYPTLSESEWFKVMITANSWKYALNTKSKIYMDRGFQYSMHYKLNKRILPMNINLFKEGISNNIDTIFSIIDCYTNSLVVETLWGNDFLFKDIEFYTDLCKLDCNFKDKNKNTATFSLNNNNLKQVNYNFVMLNLNILKFVGQIRRYEIKNNIPFKNIPTKIVEDYFYSNQKHIIKILNMTGNAHTGYNINDYLIPLFNIISKYLNYDVKNVNNIDNVSRKSSIDRNMFYTKEQRELDKLKEKEQDERISEYFNKFR